MKKITRDQYSIDTKIVEESIGIWDTKWVRVKAYLSFKDGQIFCSHAQRSTLEEAETTAINRVKILAKVQ